ncbi:MAG: hypothetical protein QM279_06810 [Atribacterota bacterium]|nr:hypothetical protein [Atribacterota bacterium]
MKTFVKNRYCEETNRFLVGRRGYLIHPLCYCEERFMRRGNLIFLFFSL